MPKLHELEGQFLKHIEEDGKERYRHVDSLEEADGIMFLCPKCFKENKGPIGTHSVLCWFTNRVPDHVQPGPGRWNPAGTSMNDLTFVPPRAVSVLLKSGCQWHGFVRNGSAD